MEVGRWGWSWLPHNSAVPRVRCSGPALKASGRLVFGPAYGGMSWHRGQFPCPALNHGAASLHPISLAPAFHPLPRMVLLGVTPLHACPLAGTASAPSDGRGGISAQIARKLEGKGGAVWAGGELCKWGFALCVDGGLHKVSPGGREPPAPSQCLHSSSLENSLWAPSLS